MIRSIKTNSIFLPTTVLTFLVLAFALLMPDIAHAGEGLSRLVQNIATEGQDSLGPGLIIAGFVGAIFCIVALGLFATHRQGKSLVAPILLLLFGGGLLSATFIMSLSSSSITQGETVSIEELIYN